MLQLMRPWFALRMLLPTEPTTKAYFQYYGISLTKSKTNGDITRNNSFHTIYFTFYLCLFVLFSCKPVCIPTC